MTPAERAIETIQRSLQRLGPFLPGSISQQFNVCGNPTCRCKDPKNPKRHGPYYQLSFTVNGRSSTRFIKLAELGEARRRIRRFQRFKRLNVRLIEAYIALARSQGL